jgi:hypothetical protein
MYKETVINKHTQLISQYTILVGVVMTAIMSVFTGDLRQCTHTNI